MYYIDFQQCTLTRICYDECPTEAIEIIGSGGDTLFWYTDIYIEEEKCIECGLCMEVCPVGAIWGSGGGSNDGNDDGDWDEDPPDEGGGGEIIPIDEDYETGLLVINELESDLNNSNILAIEHNAGVFLTSADLALQCKSLSFTLINALKASDPLIRSMGIATGIAGGLVGGVSFLIGATDGEISPSDWAIGVAAILGGAAVFVSAPVWVTILGVGSVVVGITSLILPGDSQNNTAPSIRLIN